MSEFAWTFPGGKFVQDVTSITLVNNTAKNILKTVPAGKRWILFGIKATNPDNVGRQFVIYKWKEAGKTNRISNLKTVVAGTFVAGYQTQWPAGDNSDTEQRRTRKPYEMLDPGNTLEFNWATGGASAGGTDADGLVIEYLEMDI